MTIEDFIETHYDVLERDDLDELYKRLENNNGGAAFNPHLTDYFLENGINPLDYLTGVPDHYARMLNTIDKDIVLGDNILSIGACAFTNTPLQSIKMTNVKELDIIALSGCPSLRSVIFNDEIENFPDLLLDNSQNLQYIKLPRALKHMGVQILNQAQFSFANKTIVVEGTQSAIDVFKGGFPSTDCFKFKIVK